MNIAFVINNERAVFFHKIAAKLRAAGHDAYWISPSHEWSEWLAEQGADKASVLDLTDYGPEWTVKGGSGLSDDDRTFLAPFEEHKLMINNIAMMDRRLKLKPAGYSLAYLAVSGRAIDRFLQEKAIRLVFSEHTWAHETLTYQVCKRLNIANLNPYLARIPDGRFAFFNSCHQESIEFVRQPNESDRREAEQYLEHFRNKGPKPKYWGATNSIRKFKLNWMSKFVARVVKERRYRYRYDQMTYSTAEVVKEKLSAIRNRRAVARRNPFFAPDPDAAPQRPFLLYALHADIDVLGAYFSNQLELIKAIARSTPVTHDFYVKEHPHGMGNSPLKFYEQIKAIPGVRLISPYVDSHALIKQADLVITVSGTMAYEACLYGIPTVTMERLFFRPLLVKAGFNPYSDSVRELLDQGRDAAPSDKDLVDFLAYILANSFEGEMADPYEMYTDGNIDKMAAGFAAIIELVQSKDSAKLTLLTAEEGQNHAAFDQRRGETYDYGAVRSAVSH